MGGNRSSREGDLTDWITLLPAKACSELMFFFLFHKKTKPVYFKNQLSGYVFKKYGSGDLLTLLAGRQKDRN